MHDLVIEDARIVDGTGGPSRHGSVAVKDGRIVEVGGSDEILWLREDDYELIDLEGRTVVPVEGMLAPGKPANFNVLSGDRTVEAWVEGVRRMVRP